MEFGDLLRDLEKASAFELFRLNVAIDRALEDPQRLLAVKTALHLGMETTYFDTPAWREFPCRIEQIKRTSVVVLDLERDKRFKLPYYMLNLNQVDTVIRENQHRKGMSRQELGVGDQVGFVHSNTGEQITGTVLRLNPKTVSIKTAEGRWRVGYGVLFPLIDGDAESAVAQQALASDLPINHE